MRQQSLLISRFIITYTSLLKNFGSLKKFDTPICLGEIQSARNFVVRQIMYCFNKSDFSFFERFDKNKTGKNLHCAILRHVVLQPEIVGENLANVYSMMNPRNIKGKDIPNHIYLKIRNISNKYISPINSLMSEIENYGKELNQEMRRNTIPQNMLSRAILIIKRITEGYNINTQLPASPKDILKKALRIGNRPKSVFRRIG
jgi:hypothetical protein